MGQPLTTGEVARALGLTRERVRQLDRQLQPQRGTLGVRLYDPDAVERVAAERRTAALARARGIR